MFEKTVKEADGGSFNAFSENSEVLCMALSAFLNKITAQKLISSEMGEYNISKLPQQEKEAKKETKKETKKENKKDNKKETKKEKKTAKNTQSDIEKE